MFLYANGCSHAAGSEIEYDDQDFCYQKSFIGHLAKSLNIDSFNNSAAGGGNDRIIRTTLNFIETKKEENFDLGKLFVLIAWSGPNRREFLHAKNNVNYFLFPSLITLETKADIRMANTIPEELINYYEYELLEMADSQFNNRFISSILLMESYLKQHNIKYLFISSFWNFDNIESRDNLKLYNSIDKKYFLDGGNGLGNFWQYSKSKNFVTSERGHYREDAHIEYSKVLKNYIQTVYPVDFPEER